MHLWAKPNLLPSLLLAMSPSPVLPLDIPHLFHAICIRNAAERESDAGQSVDAMGRE